jgi:hypothetical protein
MGFVLYKGSSNIDKDPVPIDTHGICGKRARRQGFLGIGKQGTREICPPYDTPVPDIEP